MQLRYLAAIGMVLKLMYHSATQISGSYRHGVELPETIIASAILSDFPSENQVMQLNLSYCDGACFGHVTIQLFVVFSYYISCRICNTIESS